MALDDTNKWRFRRVEDKKETRHVVGKEPVDALELNRAFELSEQILNVTASKVLELAEVHGEHVFHMSLALNYAVNNQLTTQEVVDKILEYTEEDVETLWLDRPMKFTIYAMILIERLDHTTCEVS